MLLLLLDWAIGFAVVLGGVGLWEREGGYANGEIREGMGGLPS